MVNKGESSNTEAVPLELAHEMIEEKLLLNFKSMWENLQWNLSKLKGLSLPNDKATSTGSLMLLTSLAHPLMKTMMTRVEEPEEEVLEGWP